MQTIYSLLIGKCFIVLNLFQRLSCDPQCTYYPNYPVINNPSVISCPNGCCGGQYPIKSNDACCISSTPTWIAYPIVAVSLIITGGIILAIICMKYKKPKPVRQVRPDSWTRQAQYPQQQGGFNPNLVTNFNQYDVWNQAPPRYDEIQHQKPPISPNSNTIKPAFTDYTITTLPGAFILPEDNKNGKSSDA